MPTLPPNGLTHHDKPQQADTRRSSVCLPWLSIRFQSRSRGATAGPLAKPLAIQGHKVDKEWMPTYDWMPDGNNIHLQQSLWSNCGTPTLLGRRPAPGSLDPIDQSRTFLVEKTRYGLERTQVRTQGCSQGLPTTNPTHATFDAKRISLICLDSLSVRSEEMTSCLHLPERMHTASCERSCFFPFFFFFPVYFFGQHS